jgi:hypothetical protein
VRTDRSRSRRQRPVARRIDEGEHGGVERGSDSRELDGDRNEQANAIMEGGRAGVASTGTFP